MTCRWRGLIESGVAAEVADDKAERLDLLDHAFTGLSLREFLVVRACFGAYGSAASALSKINFFNTLPFPLTGALLLGGHWIMHLTKKARTPPPLFSFVICESFSPNDTMGTMCTSNRTSMRRWKASSCTRLILLLRTIRPPAVLATGATDVADNLGGGSGNTAVNHFIPSLPVLFIHLMPLAVVFAFAALWSAAIFASRHTPFLLLPFCSGRNRRPKSLPCFRKTHKERACL